MLQKEAMVVQKKKAREALLEMEKFDSNVEEIDQGAVTLVVDFAKAFEKVQLQVVWAWSMHFSATAKGDLRRLCGGRCSASSTCVAGRCERSVPVLSTTQAQGFRERHRAPFLESKLKLCLTEEGKVWEEHTIQNQSY